MKNLFIILLIPFVLIGCNQSSKAEIAGAEMRAKEEVKAKIAIVVENNRLEQYVLDARLLNQLQITEIRAKVEQVVAEIEAVAFNKFWNESGKLMVIMLLAVLVLGFIIYYGLKATTSISKALADMRIQECKIKEEGRCERHQLEQEVELRKIMHVVDKFMDNKEKFSDKQQDKFLSSMLGDTAQDKLNDAA